IDPGRLDPHVESLRSHTARGTLVNSGFQLGLAGLGTVQRLAIAAWLTRAEYGLWGIIITTLITLSFVKAIGVADKYIQQNEPDQERAFQKAFTLELGLSVAFFLLVVGVLPVYGFVYGHGQIVAPGMVLALSVVLSAFEAPAWIPYRRMQYARQRTLTAIDPVVTSVLTIVLVASGAGYWGMVVGAVAGSAAGGLVCSATCPYRLRLRFDRGTLREYASFSLPLFGSGISGLVVVQGSLIVASHTVGLAGIGIIGLATNIATFADRADAIVSQTIYPAICAVVHRVDVLAETFVKSNRIALMWAAPFAVAVALFARDAIHFVLGDRWRPATGILIAFALTSGLGQVAFNWQMFMRAVNRTKPLFVASLTQLVVFFAVAVPGMYAFGVAGYAAGFAATTCVQIALRGWYMRRLFHGFGVIRQMLRAIAPTVPAAALIALVRVLAGPHRSAGRVVAELVLYWAAAGVATWVLERALVAEMLSYLLRRAPQRARSSSDPVEPATRAA
ncbi:MAG TPA: oligosaccharide flippase family protein, partial [Solirubrobacteraceae bacterium]|nr:oligosaccharide flippase family protein [Solirubrobacteraceae bacterium]